MAILKKFMAILKKLGQIYSNLSVTELVLLLLASALAAYIALVFFLGTTNFFATVVSGSMKPALERGDLVVLAKAAEYKQGDIIVFKRGADIIIHRVVLAQKEEYRTKGDNNNFTDSKPVKKADILGKSVLVLPKIGNINLFLAGK